MGCHALLQGIFPTQESNARSPALQADSLPTELWASLVAQIVKHLPAMQETQVQSLGLEDPLEKGQGTHSSILGFPCGSAGNESTCNERDLVWEDPLEKGKAAHSSILTSRIPCVCKESDTTE